METVSLIGAPTDVGASVRGAHMMLRTFSPIALVSALSLLAACSSSEDPPGQPGGSFSFRRVLRVGCDNGSRLLASTPAMDHAGLPRSVYRGAGAPFDRRPEMKKAARRFALATVRGGPEALVSGVDGGSPPQAQGGQLGGGVRRLRRHGRQGKQSQCNQQLHAAPRANGSTNDAVAYRQP